jgi:hypothetical protein
MPCFGTGENETFRAMRWICGSLEVKSVPGESTPEGSSWGHIHASFIHLSSLSL